MNKIYLKNIITKNICTALIFTFAILLLMPIKVYAAGESLYFTQQSSAELNKVLAIQVRVNPNGTTVGPVQADFGYQTDKLQFISIDYTGSAFPQTMIFTNYNGEISIVRGNLGPPTVATDSLIATVNFRVVSTASSNLTFRNSSAIVDGSSNNILSAMNNTTINPTNTGIVPVHRFYNFKQGVHFYTSNQAEATNINNTMYNTFRYEGIAHYVYSSSGSSRVPVHRFYNFKQGVHFYTSNQAEATNINNTMYNTFRYEGVSYYANPSMLSGTSAVHRFYNFKQGVHFYTSNQAEATNINNTMYNTFRYEGIAHYVYP